MRSKKILSIIMSVIMLLAMVPSTAFAATDGYDLWVYEEGNIDDNEEAKHIIEDFFSDGKDEPDAERLLKALQEEKLVDESVTADRLSYKFYNGDQTSNLQKGKKATEYGFTKAKLKLDHLICVYSIAEPEFAGTVTYNIYDSKDEEAEPVAVIVKGFDEGETYEDIAPTYEEIVQTLEDNGYAAEENKKIVTSAWYGDTEWETYRESYASATPFDMTEEAADEGSLNCFVKQSVMDITVVLDGEEEEFKAGDTVGNIEYTPEARETGFEFAGWSEDGTSDGILDDDTVLENGMELTSVWSKDVYYAAYFDDGSEAVTGNQVKVYYDETLPEVDDIVRTDGEIGTNDTVYGWYSQAIYNSIKDGTVTVEDAEVTEKCESGDNLYAYVVKNGGAERVTAEFDLNGGTVKYSESDIRDSIKSETVIAGETVWLPGGAMQLEGWEFAGWYVDGELVSNGAEDYSIDEDTTLTAEWKKDIKFTIYDYNAVISDETDGKFYNNKVSEETVTVLKGKELVSVDEYYDESDKIGEDDGLYGWYSDEVATSIGKGEIAFADAEKLVNADDITDKINAYVVKDENGDWITVTFDADGGSFADSGSKKTVDILSGSTLSEKQLAEPSNIPTGWTFKGWYDADDNYYSSSTVISKSIELIAKYEKIADLYIFDSENMTAGGHTGVVNNVTLIRGEDIPAVDETFTIGKYDTVYGWYDQQTWEALYQAKDDLFAAAAVDTADDGGKYYVAVVVKNAEAPRATVTFDSNGGSEVDSVTVIAGESMGSDYPDDPTLSGWTFAGWFDAEGRQYDAYTEITDSVELTAKWTREITLYAVRDSYDDIAGVVVYTVEKGEALPGLDELSDVFEGLVIGEDDSVTKWYDGTTWEAHKTNFEELFKNTTVNDADDMADFYVAVIVTDGTLASWTVTYDVNGGSGTFSSEEVKDGKTATEPTDPTKAKRTFEGWYIKGTDEKFDFNTPVTKDIDLEARWSIKVELNVYKDGFSAPAYRPVQATLELDENNFQEEIAKFMEENVVLTEYDSIYGWYGYSTWVNSILSGSGNEEKIANARTADAIDLDSIDSGDAYRGTRGFCLFTVILTDDKAATVKFENVIYADPVEPVKVVKGSAVADFELENVADGYQLEGWYNGETKVDLETATFDADTTLKAKWQTEVTYNIYSNNDFDDFETETEWVTLKINGGTGKAAKEAPTYGWYDKSTWEDIAAGQDITFDNAETVGDMTVSAPTTFYGMNVAALNVTFNAGKGVVAGDMPEAETVAYGSTVSNEAKEAVPTRDKYQFAYWTVDGEEVNLDTYTVTKDTEFVAVWEARDIIVKFDISNSDVVENPADVTIKYGETTTEPTVTVPDKYKLDGWYTDEDCEEKVNFATLEFTEDETTLYAKLQAEVEYNLYENNAIKPEVTTEYVAVGEKAELSEPDENAGKFYGWYDEATWLSIKAGGDYTFENTDGLEELKVTEPVALYGQLAEGHTVTFSAGEGVKAEDMPDPLTVTVAHGEKVEEPATDPTRTGYKFIGWDYDFDKAVTADTTITAKWEKEVYKITYDPNGGTILNEADKYKTVSYGDTYGQLLDKDKVSRSGFTFLGWTTVKDNASTQVKSTDKYTANTDSTLYALWDASKVAVTYHANGGTVKDDDENSITSEYINYESSVTREAEKENLVFEGWYLDEDLTEKYNDEPVTENIDLYAKYQAEIIFKLYENDTWSATMAEDKVVLVDEYDEIAMPEAEDFGIVLGDTDEFNGWYTADEFHKVQNGETANKFEGTATEALTLYANVIRHYTVTFNSNGGSDVAPQDVVYKGYAVEPETPEKTGHKFVEWLDENGNEFNFETTIITQNRTLKAEWARAGYTVTFDTDEENTGVEGSVVTVKYNLPVNTEEKDGKSGEIPDTDRNGYTFDGWYLDGKLYDLSTPVTDNITLVANWHKNEFNAVVDGTYVYTGAAITPNVVVTDTLTGGELVKALYTVTFDVDSTVENNNAKMDYSLGLPLNAGAYVAIVKPVSYGGYDLADTVTVKFTVGQADLSEYTYTISSETAEDGYAEYDPENLEKFIYSGDEIIPEVIIANGDLLEEETDYTLTYDEDTISAGTKSITVTGVGNYTGTKVLNYIIERVQIDISGYTATIAPESFVYDGTPKQPSVTVMLSMAQNSLVDENGNVILTYGEDYNVGYMPVSEGIELVDGQPVNAGIYEVVIEGVGNYTGTIASSPQFTIERKAINSEGVTFEFDEEADYTGEPIEPVVTVKDGDTTLTLGVDYKVEYSNNTNAGAATITVSGLGNYKNLKKLTFYINGATSLEDENITAEIEDEDDIVFDGENQTPNVIVKDGDTVLTEDTDYEVVEYKNNVDAGTASVSIKGIGKYKDEITVEFTIKARSIADAVISDIPEQEETGEAIEPEFTVTDDLGNSLVKDTDYKVEYRNNTAAGEATVTISGIGNYTGSAETTFTIKEKAEQLYHITGVVKYTSGKVISGATVTLKGTDLVNNVSVSQKTTTNSDGRFVFEGLHYGDYKVTYKGIAVEGKLNPGSYNG